MHNGIIENFREMKEELIAKGHQFQTQTDTEVVAHAIADQRALGKSPVDAVKAVLPRLHGAFAFAILFKSEPDLLIGARQRSPLAVGHGEGQLYLGSDAIALAPFTNKVTYLEDGDWVVVTRGSVKIFDANNMPILCQFVSKKHRATAYGLMNMVGVFAGAFITDLLGKSTDVKRP